MEQLDEARAALKLAAEQGKDKNEASRALGLRLCDFVE
jgi:hypothetical protein